MGTAPHGSLQTPLIELTGNKFPDLLVGGVCVPQSFNVGDQLVTLILEVYYTAKILLSSVNTVLLLGLLVTYVDIFNQVRSEFTIGLIALNVALLLYALTSNPLIHQWLGFMGSGLGPFAMLPDLFTLIASAMLLYLSQK